MTEVLVHLPILVTVTDDGTVTSTAVLEPHAFTPDAGWGAPDVAEVVRAAALARAADFGAVAGALLLPLEPGPDSVVVDPALPPADPTPAPPPPTIGTDGIPVVEAPVVVVDPGAALPANPSLPLPPQAAEAARPGKPAR
jgi:hypothetical protein